MPFLYSKLRRPQLLAVLLTFTAGLLAAVFILRKVRRHRMDPVLLADPNSLYTVVLKRREAIGHNVKLLRFALPSYTQRLGVRIGEHIMVRALVGHRLIVRPYTPVSPCDRRGTFDIIVKVYRAGVCPQFPQGGVMSQFLDSLKPGDDVQRFPPLVSSAKLICRLTERPYPQSPYQSRVACVIAYALLETPSTSGCRDSSRRIRQLRCSRVLVVEPRLP
ncbi:hypothetical protein HPB51_000663 [Rhipicephalus microplus]|uniref:FAD-binding FR-type domain-containing protein n=1 Tax=Rhipicephalus microplus TaxID=6941 RepID=A0A9J6DRG1_RHIMP|nr:hypothetical protein HPB51_000663 [Rhipicephalus microplus]